MKQALTFIMLLCMSTAFGQSVTENSIPFKTERDTTEVYMLVTTGKSTVVHFIKAYKVLRCQTTPSTRQCTLIEYRYNKRKRIPRSWHIIKVFDSPTYLYQGNFKIQFLPKSKEL